MNDGMMIDDCSEFRGHKLKNCSRCGHQFDALKLTRLNCDELNAIKDKESQFGFRWKLSDWAIGEVVKVDVCPSCYASVVNLINTNEMIENLERNTLLAKKLNIPMCKCQICHKELSKNNFRNIPHYIITDILMNPDDYFVRWPRSEHKAFIDFLDRSAYVKTVKVCPSCYEGLFHEYLSNEARRLKEETDNDTEHHELPIYINGNLETRIARRIQNSTYGLEGCCLNRNDMVDAAMYAYEKLKNERKISKFKLEERKMKNVNETKNTAAFAIERNYDETDRKLFRLEDAETGDFIRLATDEDRLIYMVVNIAPVKSRIKLNEQAAHDGVWCVCIQTQDLVELPLSEMVYVYDPRYIAFRIGRFIDA